MTSEPSDEPANDTATKGLPSRHDARLVWQSMRKPSTRKGAGILRQRGYDISDRTYARWAAVGFRDVTTVTEKGKVAGELQRVLAKLPAGQVEEAKDLAAIGGIEAAISGGSLRDADYARIETRRRALALLSYAQLDHAEAMARKILNIVLMEEATRRAHIMVLIPKETGCLVDSFTTAAQSTITGGDGQVPDDDDPRVINGTTNVEPANPIASAIDKFLMSEEAA